MGRKNREPVEVKDLLITDAGAEGMAVAKLDGLTIFVPFAVPGDVVDVQLIKKKKSYAEARVTRVVKPSEERCEARCTHFGLCGGCKWQIMPYEKQLFYKQKQVEDAFKHIGKFDFPELQPIIASEKQYFYRNKLEYTFSCLRWLSDSDNALREAGEPVETDALGFHIPGKFDRVLDIDNCYLQEEPSNSIRLALRKFAKENNLSFYNIRAHEGLLRNVVIRKSSTNELMVIMIFSRYDDDARSVMEFLADNFPQITSLLYIVNDKYNDSFTDLEVNVFKGEAFIYEKMDELRFKIGPVSFFQINTAQACRLYSVAREFAEIKGTDVVYDLYTGTGTIANFVARDACKVIGIEYVESAIDDARVNSAVNGISNTVFYAGDMAKVLTKEFVDENGRPDVVITDPPRAGMAPKVVQTLLDIEPERIVYVSCNPATQARDLTLLDQKYRVVKVQPVDMFPQTHHVENVVLLVKR
ncbi:MAG: 23S rRNA (uracil(1939)-C(5))-methyltransferase RlmD [Bacteroidales bacterium]|nr:23S rRNA (uracil(1939)-C(5))-methyltransferase RlmD [Bacteroidales bacterium]